jgi:hypothetical protein
MSTALSTIFGSDIKVGYSPPVHRRSFAGFPGAHGVTAQYLGTRGYEITVTGILWTTARSGSPFQHRRAVELASKYRFERQESTSSYYGSPQPVVQQNEYQDLKDHIDFLRDANEDMTISGRFTLERMWLNDNAGGGLGQPVFLPGDQIQRITGRQRDLAASFGATTVWPEIVSVVYQPNAQRQQLITRDLRFAAPRL